jgi:hypothetical protein
MSNVVMEFCVGKGSQPGGQVRTERSVFVICLLIAVMAFVATNPVLAVVANKAAIASQPPIVPGRPSFKRVFIIVLENTAAETALRQPYLKSLLRRGGYLNNFFAVSHPSQPNYIAMTSGSTQNVTDNAPVSLAVRHVGDLLEASNMSWRQYAGNFPGHCFLGERHGNYARKHAPFMSYRDVQNDSARCANAVDANRLDRDIADGNLADFSLYVPDMDDDGHDTGVGFADRWLRQAFDAKFRDPRFMKDTLVVVTFDEDDGAHGNHIYTLLLGDSVIPGSGTDVRYDFYNLLRTIEAGFDLETLGANDAKAEPIAGIWK